MHRESPKRNGESVALSQGSGQVISDQSMPFLRDHSVFCDWCRGGRYYVEGVPGKDDMDLDAPAGCRYGYDGERDDPAGKRDLV